MRIKMHIDGVGPGGVYLAGHEYDLPSQEARDLCKRGMAAPVRSRKFETAVRSPSEVC